MGGGQIRFAPFVPGAIVGSDLSRTLSTQSGDMKQMKRMLAYCLLLLVPCAVLADQASDMMGEYMNMGENT